VRNLSATGASTARVPHARVLRLGISIFEHDVNRLQDKAERDGDRYSATFIDWITLAPGVIRL